MPKIFLKVDYPEFKKALPWIELVKLILSKTLKHRFKYLNLQIGISLQKLLLKLKGFQNILYYLTSRDHLCKKHPLFWQEVIHEGWLVLPDIIQISSSLPWIYFAYLSIKLFDLVKILLKEIIQNSQ